MTVETQEFLDAVFGLADMPDGQAVCIAKDTGNGFMQRAWPSKTYERSKAQPWYYCISTVKPEVTETGALRRRKQDVVETYVIVLDDIGTKCPIPETPPSYVMETSPGNFQYGYLLDPPDARIDRVEGLIAQLVEKGATDPGAKGATRVVRLPGSLNIKPAAKGFRSRVTQWAPDTVYSLENLAEAFGVPWSETEAPPTKIHQIGSAVEDVVSFDPVVKWMEERGMIVGDDGDWLRIVCPWKDEEGAHTTGPEAGYSPLGRGRVAYRGFNCFHAHKEKITTGQFLSWVADNGGPVVAIYDPLPALQERYVYVEQERMVADMHQRPLGGFWRLTKDEFESRAPGTFKPPGADRAISLRKAWLDDEKTPRAARFVYRPGAPAMFDVQGQPVVNTWTPPPWPETQREPKAFLQHMEYLIPEPRERKLFLDWLAFKAQNPEKRSFAMVMVADRAYGTGRSWVAQTIANTFPGSVNKATLADLIGQNGAFNGWASECEFVIVEEAKDVTGSDYYHGYEVFKQYVDTRPIDFTCNPKFGRQRQDTMWFNALILTNHVDALVIPEDDRRVAVVTNPPVRKERDYYDALERASQEGEAQKLYWHLMRRDVSAFDHVYPPDTAAKVVMSSASRSPADELYDWLVDQPDVLYTRESAVKKLNAGLREFEGVWDLTSGAMASIRRQVWNRLFRLKPDRNGFRILLYGKRVEVRATKDADYWARRAAQGTIEQGDVFIGDGPKLVRRHEQKSG